MQVAKAIDPLSLALAPHAGNGRVDREIIRLQNEARAGKNTDATIERLGWSFVAKARESFDPGYYKLAEQCGWRWMEVVQSLEAMPLRGHVLHNFHRLQAETVGGNWLGSGAALISDC